MFARTTITSEIYFNVLIIYVLKTLYRPLNKDQAGGKMT